jgi:hypothetical protein
VTKGLDKNVEMKDTGINCIKKDPHALGSQQSQVFGGR